MKKVPLIRNRLIGDKVTKMFLVNQMTQAQISRELSISKDTVRRILRARMINGRVNAPGYVKESLLEKLFHIYEPDKFKEK